MLCLGGGLVFPKFERPLGPSARIPLHVGRALTGSNLSARRVPTYLKVCGKGPCTLDPCNSWQDKVDGSAQRLICRQARGTTCNSATERHDREIWREREALDTNCSLPCSAAKIARVLSWLCGSPSATWTCNICHKHDVLVHCECKRQQTSVHTFLPRMSNARKQLVHILPAQNRASVQEATWCDQPTPKQVLQQVGATRRNKLAQNALPSEFEFGQLEPNPNATQQFAWGCLDACVGKVAGL